MAVDESSFFDRMRRTREAYGYAADPPVPLSMDEMKEGERRNAATIITEVLAQYADTGAGSDPWGPWHSRFTHNRDLPAYAHHTIAHNCWTPDAAATLALGAWCQPEWPGQYPARKWRDMFTSLSRLPLCSETQDDPDATCPVPHDQPLKVYRAAFSSEKRGLAWTLDRDVAVWFAARGDMAAGGPGKGGRRMRLWVATVEFDRTYAHITSRNESEIVCDVRSLPITEESLTD